MKIGMNLLLYTTDPDESIFPTVEKLKGMGYDGMEWPILGTDRKTAEKIRAFNEKHKMPSSAVYAFGPGTNPISMEASERAAALTTIKDRIEVCAALGSPLLCGPIVQTLGHFTGVGPTQQEWKYCVEYLKQAGDHAAKNNVTLVVEYLNRFEIYLLNTAVDAARMCDDVNHPNVKTMVDSFHGNIEEKSLYDAVLAAKRHLKHIHVSENDRGVPGSSKSIQWDDYFRGIKDAGYDGWLMIESFGTALPALAAAAKIWRPLFKDADEVGREGIAFIKAMMKKVGLS